MTSASAETAHPAGWRLNLIALLAVMQLIVLFFFSCHYKPETSLCVKRGIDDSQTGRATRRSDYRWKLAFSYKRHFLAFFFIISV